MTDAKDAEWLAELCEVGLLRGSFLPPAEIAAIREVTRYRNKLTEARTSELQRLCKVLEDGGVKIDSVASSITTRSARAMVEALIAGERDPRVLAELALGRMRKKIPDLAMALQGRFGEHHALLARMHLEHIDQLTGMIGRLDTQVEQLVAPFAEQVRRLCTIPGIAQRTAQVLIAEPGSRGAAIRPGPLRTVHAVKWAAGEVPVARVLFRRPLPEPDVPGFRGIRLSSAHRACCVGQPL